MPAPHLCGLFRRMELARLHRLALWPRLIGVGLALGLLVGANTAPHAEGFAGKLAAAALERTGHAVLYDGAYQTIPYPNGDVSPFKGVCTDVVIRSYRRLGIDLQKLVHEDMRADFAAYPSQRIWGLTKPDPNIDHRRVPNLRVFFARHGQSLAVTDDPAAYRPGDLVTWRLANGRPHIGIVSSRTTRAGRPKVVHNVGWGPKLEDKLFAYELTGHYRFEPLEELDR